MDKLLLYKALKNKSGAEISASGNPVTLSGTLADNPLKECKIYGWSKQESTTGRNLFQVKDEPEKKIHGVTWQAQDGIISVHGKSTGTTNRPQLDYYLLGREGVYEEVTFPIATITVTAMNLPKGTILYVVKQENSKVVVALTSTYAHASFTHTANQKYRIMLRPPVDQQLDTDGIKITFSAGTDPIPWEPYTGGQPSPNPEYPQEIISAGSDGKIGIEVRGKNLLKIRDRVQTARGVTVTAKDGVVTLKGTATATGWVILDTDSFVLDGTYILSSNITAIQVRVANKSHEEVLKQNKSKTLENEEVSKVVFPVTSGKTYDVSNILVQIEKGSESTSYEPYHEPQSLPISAPTGLPAIPVGTGGNYTDANGQQWIADYVDLKRGKYVQMIQTDKVQSNITWNIQKQPRGYSLGYATLYKNGISTQKPGMGNTWKSNMGDSSNMWSNGFSFGRSTVFWIVPYENDGNITSDDINAWLAEHPMDIMYPLATPIEHDLTRDEIQAYQNLVTYAGTTIVENDADCYMEVSAGGGGTLRAKKLALILGD